MNLAQLLKETLQIDTKKKLKRFNFSYDRIEGEYTNEFSYNNHSVRIIFDENWTSRINFPRKMVGANKKGYELMFEVDEDIESPEEGKGFDRGVFVLFKEIINAAIAFILEKKPSFITYSSNKIKKQYFYKILSERMIKEVEKMTKYKYIPPSNFEEFASIMDVSAKNLGSASNFGVKGYLWVAPDVYNDYLKRRERKNESR